MKISHKEHEDHKEALCDLRVLCEKTVQIRNARIPDAHSLSALAMQTYAEAFGHSFSPADLAAHLEKNLSPKNFERMLEEDTFRVAETDGRAVGFIQFGCGNLETDSGNAQELRRLYVLADFQNIGIGTQLMNAALESPEIKNAASVFLDVWEHNLGAQRFYARYGFVVTGKCEFVVESGAETSCDLIMVRCQS